MQTKNKSKTSQQPPSHRTFAKCYNCTPMDRVLHLEPTTPQTEPHFCFLVPEASLNHLQFTKLKTFFSQNWDNYKFFTGLLWRSEEIMEWKIGALGLAQKRCSKINILGKQMFSIVLWISLYVNMLKLFCLPVALPPGVMTVNTRG